MSSSRPLPGKEITDVGIEQRRTALDPIEESPDRRIRKQGMSKHSGLTETADAIFYLTYDLQTTEEISQMSARVL